MSDEHVKQTEYRHVVKKSVLGRVPELPISSERFEEIVQARRGISETLGMEEKYNLLLENYVEFEECLLHSTVQMVIFTPLDWSDFIDHRQLFNRRILNLLAAGRLLLDQLKHHMSSLFGSDSTERHKIEEGIRDAYGNHLGFRVIEALRNYVQHRDLPVEGFSQPNWRAGVEPESERRATVTPLLFITKLSDDPKFNRSVVTELQQFNQDSIDLKPLVREWVTCLISVHGIARALVDEVVQEWDAAVKLAVSEYMEKHGSDIVGLSAVELDKRGIGHRRVWLGTAPSERRDLLRKRTIRTQSLERVDITSASRDRPSG